MYTELFLKAATTLALVVYVAVDLKKQTKKKNENPVIAAADEKERYSWRYFWWLIRAVPLAAAYYLFWKIINSTLC